jgi:NlpC/P60 family putative phage cell wall peptidase
MTLPNGPSRQEIVAEAMTWLETPYVHQASTKGVGTDCLGLVRGVYRQFYGEEPVVVPPYTADWHGADGEEPLLSAAEQYLHEQPADGLVGGNVVLFRMVPAGPAKHMGILTDEDSFIHAYAGRKVCQSWLGRWWAARIAGLYAFPGVA